MLDTIAGDTRTRSLRTLRPGGLLVSILPYGKDELDAEAQRLGVRAELLLVEADHAGMNAIADLVEQGALRPRVEATFTMPEIRKAHEAGETGRTTGKLVLVVRDDV